MIGPYPLVEPMAAGQAVEVEAADNPRAGLFESTVVALTPEHVAIALPQRHEETLPLSPGATLRIRYQGQVSKYAFETVVRAVGHEVVTLDLPAGIDIASRRADRVPLHRLPVSVLRVEHDNEELRGVGIDMSAWGMRVILPRPLEQWERVRAAVILPDGPLVTDAQVVRIDEEGPSEIAHGFYYPHLTSDELNRLRLLGG